jgi:hypothetical protein
MNIFENESGILGSYSVDGLNRSFKEFLGQAVKIRMQLGSQSYLLDQYLSNLFEAASEVLAYEAATKGFEAVSTINSLCSEILRGDAKNNDHPLYEQVKSFIDAHPMRYQVHFTRLSLSSLMLSCDLLKPLCKQYYMEIAANVNASVDTLELKSLYLKIYESLDSEKEMELLNLLFSQRFLIAKAMDVFLQEMTNQLLYSLTYRDRETSKQVFQLLFDEDLTTN